MANFVMAVSRNGGEYINLDNVDAYFMKEDTDRQQIDICARLGSSVYVLQVINATDGDMRKVRAFAQQSLGNYAKKANETNLTGGINEPNLPAFLHKVKQNGSAVTRACLENGISDAKVIHRYAVAHCGEHIPLINIQKYISRDTLNK